MVIVKAAELGRERISRLVFVDALALSPGEQVGKIVQNCPASNTVSELTTGPARADAEKRLFAERAPDVRAWVLRALYAASRGRTQAPMAPTTFWGSKWPATANRRRRAVNPPESHQRRTAERLHADYHELDTGHYPMLSQPEELTPLSSPSSPCNPEVAHDLRVQDVPAEAR